MVSKNILDNMNTIPIFNVLNVRGYCVYIEGILRTFVFAEDIAREAGISTSSNYSTFGVNGDAKIYQKSSIRWDRFNKYIELALPAIESRCPEILPLIQLPIHRYSYIPAEVALVILMHCESAKAVDFQVVLSCKIIPEIQRYAVRTYELQIMEMQNDIDDLQEVIDYNNINIAMNLEEENEFLKNFIKERKYRLDAYDLKCLKGIV